MCVNYSYLAMSGEKLRVELYVRSLVPRQNRSRQSTVLNQLKSLSIEDKIVDYDLVVCGKRLPANPGDARTTFGTYLLNRITVFELWAAQNDISLNALFDRRRIDSTITGETGTELVFPTMVLAEYEGTDLRFVTPCETADRTWRVTDRLRVLEEGREPTDVEPLPDARSEKSSHEDRLTLPRE